MLTKHSDARPSQLSAERRKDAATNTSHDSPPLERDTHGRSATALGGRSSLRGGDETGPLALVVVAASTVSAR